MNSTKIYVPCDAAALSVGADEVAHTLQSAIELRKLDAKIIRTGSRGLFWLEPLVEVEIDGTRIAYGPVGAGDIPSLLETDLLNGGDHDLCLGPTEDIPFLAKQERLTFARCGVIDPLDLGDYENHGGLAGLRKAASMPRDAITQMVSDSGLRGRGGAGFPTGIKWKTAMDAVSAQKYICCNADEGDSGTFADRMLMEGDPFCLLEGMVIAGFAVDATKGFIYVRSEYPNAIKTLNRAVAIWNDAGFLGDNIEGSGRAFDIEIRRGAGAYICGEESSMLDSLEGKRGLVRAKPPIPALEGLFGKPTIVNNVLSLAAVPLILEKGAAFYKSYGMGRSRGTQAFQLAGNIKHGGLVEKAFGVSLRELIEDFGGGTLSGKPLRAVQAGGPLGAYLPDSKLDLPMDYESLAAAGAMLGHGGLVVFDESVDMAKQAEFAMEFCAIESCGKCTPCRIGSTRGVEVISRIRAGQDVDKNIALIKDLCEVMEEGSLCAMGGLTPMPVLSALEYFPEDFDQSKKPGASS